MYDVSLGDLQRPISMLSWEDKQFLGGEKIVEHLVVRPPSLSSSSCVPHRLRKFYTS
jgi:hypothetical protein